MPEPMVPAPITPTGVLDGLDSIPLTAAAAAADGLPED